MPHPVSENTIDKIEQLKNDLNQQLGKVNPYSNVSGLSIFNNKIPELDTRTLGYIRCHSKGHEKNHGQGCYARFGL
jgi:FMN-dependent NADH-azoreductase